MDNLDFGLIQLGRSASLQFEVINESHCTVSFHLQQLVKHKKVFMVSLSASSDFACKYKYGIISNITIKVVLKAAMAELHTFSWLTLLIREGNMLLVRYSLDTRARYSTYSLNFESQKGSIEALNFLIITS